MNSRRAAFATGVRIERSYVRGLLPRSRPRSVNSAARLSRRAGAASNSNAALDR